MSLIKVFEFTPVFMEDANFLFTVIFLFDFFKQVTATGAGSKTTSYLRGSAASFFYGYIDTDGELNCINNTNIDNTLY